MRDASRHNHLLSVCFVASIYLGIFGGVVDAQSQGIGDPQHPYATRVVQELQKRKFYPSKAEAANIGGTIDFSFTIGPTGRVVEHAITRSSGHPILDKAVGTILARIRPGPPPNGRWGARTSIKFVLDQPRADRPD